MAKNTIQIFMAFLILFFFACEDEKSTDHSKNFIGKWSVESISFSAVIDGETYSETEDYSSYPITLKEFGEFTSSSLIFWDNEVCTGSYESETTQVSYSSDEVTINEDGYDMDYSYSFNGDNLTLSSTYSEMGESVTTSLVLKSYSGSLPPAEWSSAAEGDSYEPDNNATTATGIALGSTGQDHTLLCDVDYISFNAEAGNTYVIDIDSEFDSYITLYDASGSYITYDDDAYPTVDDNDMDATLEWSCSTTGTYYVEIKDWDDEYEGGPYNVTVEVAGSSARIITVEPTAKKENRIKRFSEILRAVK